MDGMRAPPARPARRRTRSCAQGPFARHLPALVIPTLLILAPVPALSSLALARADSDATAIPALPEPAPPADTLTFEAAFDAFGPPSPLTSPQPGAVDLATITPPRGPRVLRSLGTGTASYYGKRFHGRLTANGERFDMNALTAAHKTLPFGTRVRVTNPSNGRAVTVRINDRGPFIKGRSIDLSRRAAREIGMIQRGHARVQLDIVAP